MNYTNFHGQPFLLINEDAGEFPLPVKKQEVDLTMHYRTVGEVIHCRFFNKDGGEAELCGNALFSFMKENKAPAFYTFQTKAGKIEGLNTGKELRLGMVKAKNIMHSKLNELCEMWQINIGNKHEVILYNEAFEKHIYSRFLPNKSNVFNLHLVKKQDTNTFEVRCFERGVGETQACGSGAYAVGSAMIKHFNLDEVKIIMQGGEYIVKPQTLIVKL